MTSETPFPITGIPEPDGGNWIRHGGSGSVKTIPYVENIPVRYEITEWYIKAENSKDDPVIQKQWTLFILGLARFMRMEIKDKLSYFQVAGIHGFPLQPWDGADPPVKAGTEPGSNPEDGYCAHNTIAFPTWHRPYLMLYEQCLWLNMKDLINGKDEPDHPNPFKGLSDEDKKLWTAAADSWRLPYWDWARRQAFDGPGGPVYRYAYPEICTVLEVPVWLPKGGRTMIKNPLERFECPERDPVTKKPVKFGEIKDVKFRIPDDNRPKVDKLPWSQCTATSRYGILREKPGEGPFSGLDGVNAWQRGNEAIALATDHFYYMRRGKNKNPPSDVKKVPSFLGDAVLRMFSEKYIGTWGEFASTKWYKEQAVDRKTGYMSLEYIHNNLHNLAGGGKLRPKDGNDNTYGLGHMSEVPVSAFDPIFWLHHGNVDRLCAIWQAMNWEKWWDTPEPPRQDDPEPGEPYKRVKDKKPDDPLQPFHKGKDPQGKAIDWTSTACRDWTLGGYTYDDLLPPKEVLEKDGSLVEQYYKRYLRLHINEMYYSTEDVARKLRELRKDDLSAIFGDDVAGRETATFQDYIINVVYDRYALNGSSYTIKFYLSRHGPDDFEADDLEADSNDLVGEVYSFGGLAPATDSSSGCTNCGTQKEQGTLSRAQLPITVPLLLLSVASELGATNKVNRSNVKPFLKRNLSWKYISSGGNELSEENFPKTSVLVYAGLSESYKVDTESPSYAFLDVSGEEEIFSTPQFGVNDGGYLRLFDATQERRQRLDLADMSPALSFEGLSLDSDMQYSEDDW